MQGWMHTPITPMYAYNQVQGFPQKWIQTRLSRINWLVNYLIDWLINWLVNTLYSQLWYYLRAQLPIHVALLGQHQHDSQTSPAWSTFQVSEFNEHYLCTYVNSELVL